MFAFIGAIVGWIVAGAEVALEAIVVVLQWMVAALWAVVTTIYNGLISVGTTVLRGFQRAWDFLKATYEDVLKPAWQKFWTLFDRVRRWLDTTFAPVFRVLRTIRDTILDFYRHFIRPVLDIVDATRAILRVLASLHVPFAAALERQIGKAEDWVNRKFELVLSALNQVINIVNRVVTADGLFQRLAFIRTYARDVDLAFRAMHFARLTPLAGGEPAGLGEPLETRTPRETLDDFIAYAETAGGPLAPFVEQGLADIREAAILLA